MKDTGSVPQDWTLWELEYRAFGSLWVKGSRKLGQSQGAWQRVMATIGKALVPVFPMGVLMQREKKGKWPYRKEECRTEAM